MHFGRMEMQPHPRSCDFTMSLFAARAGRILEHRSHSRITRIKRP